MISKFYHPVFIKKQSCLAISQIISKMHGAKHEDEIIKANLRLNFTECETFLCNLSHFKTNSVKTILFCYKCIHWELSSPP